MRQLIPSCASHSSGSACTPVTTAMHCGHCALHATGVASADVMRRRVKKRQVVFHQGDACSAVYAVCSGTLKSTMGSADGAERIVGFPTPGDLLGLDGGAYGHYSTTTIALEDTQLCSVAPARFTTHSTTQALGREVMRMQLLLLLMGSANADARLAHYLLNHARQLGRHGYSEQNFVLKMSRADLGSYLGLSLETVSRSFSALQRLDLLLVDNRSVRIADPVGLGRLAQSNYNRQWQLPVSKSLSAGAGDYQIRTRPVSNPVITT